MFLNISVLISFYIYIYTPFGCKKNPHNMLGNPIQVCCLFFILFCFGFFFTADAYEEDNSGFTQSFVTHR